MIIFVAFFILMMSFARSVVRSLALIYFGFFFFFFEYDKFFFCIVNLQSILDTIVPGNVQQLQAHGPLGVLFWGLSLSVLPVRPEIRRMPLCILEQSSGHQGVASARMANGRSDIRHYSVHAELLQSCTRLYDSHQISSEIRAPIRMDAVVYLIHLRRYCR